MVCYHSINSDNNNNIKGAAIVRRPQQQARQRQQQQTISIPQEEMDLIRNVINIAGFYVTRNPQVFQQPEEIIKKLTEAFNIIATKQEKNSLKGASNNNNNNICPNKKKENLKLLLNMFNL